MGKWVCEKHITAFDIGTPCHYCVPKPVPAPSEHTINPVDLSYSVRSGILPLPFEGRMTVRTLDGKVLFRYSVGIVLAIYNSTNATTVPDQLVNLGYTCTTATGGCVILCNVGIAAVKKAFGPLGVVV